MLRKNARISVTTNAKKSPGRPSKLTPDVANTIVAMIAAGNTVASAAAAADVTPRAIQHWRARAYSRRPEDRAYVELEQFLQRAKLAAAEYEPQLRREPDPDKPTLEELLRDLDVD